MLTGQSPSHLKSRPSPASSGTICPGTVGRPDVAKVLKGGASMPPGMKAPGTHNPASVPFAAWDNKEWVLQDGGPGPAPSPGLHGEVSPCLARKTPPQGQPSLLTSLLLPALPWGGGLLGEGPTSFVPTDKGNLYHRPSRLREALSLCLATLGLPSLWPCPPVSIWSESSVPFF